MDQTTVDNSRSSRICGNEYLNWGNGHSSVPTFVSGFMVRSKLSRCSSRGPFITQLARNRPRTGRILSADAEGNAVKGFGLAE
jgi:hypothetical protein